MAELPTNEFVEVRNGAYYVRGTRIGLAALVWPLRRGETIEDLMDGFPTIGLERMQGIVSFIDEHPDAIEQYLSDEERRWVEMTKKFPMDPDLAREWQEGTRHFRESA